MKISIVKCIYALIAFFVFSSCTENIAKETEPIPQGKDAVLLLDIKVERNGMMENSSKAVDATNLPNEGTDSNYKVKDFWIFEYNSSGKLIASEYQTIRDVSENVKTYANLKLPTSGETYSCVLVANTHDGSFPELLKNAATLDALKEYGKKITGFSSLYSDGSDLYMNGIAANITSTTAKVDFTVHRNVAKLTLDLTNNASSKVVITSVQVRNVPERLIYADQLWQSDTEDGTTISSGVDDCQYIDLPIDNIYLEEGEKQSFIYYLPRNQKGKGNASNVKDKNKNAPDNATYVEIYGIDTSNGSTLRYRFYIGEDMVSDFNVKPNYHYTLPITIKAAGDVAADSRVESFESANCYMIDPNTTDRVHYVPINRVNEFWGHYGSSEPLDANTEWTADVIWNDQSEDLISFCRSDGAEVNAITLDNKGFMPISFKVKGKEGNVLIGVKKKGETDYLWSWHLWITSYNPDEDSNCLYDNDNSDYYMDRNLGALENSMNKKAYGFFYQFGRKDPIPHDEINGYSYSNNIETIQNYGVSVKKPNAFIYTGSLDTRNWATDGTSSNPWNNPDWNTSSTKSFFDPSPAGWHVPDACDFFRKEVKFSSDENIASITDSKGHTSYFPLTGGHNYSSVSGSSGSPSNNGMHYVGERTYYWTNNCSDDNNAHYLCVFLDNKSSYFATGSKGYGLSVRCVRDKK